MHWLLRRRRKIFFALVALALFCLLAEITARLWLAGYTRRRYGIDLDAYKAVPLINDRGLGWRWGGRVVFRGEREVSERKAPGVFRIITTGDSCCWGAPAPDNATFSAVLERILRRRYGADRVEVLNAGVVGYNSGQVTALVQDTLSRFAPDVVIYYGTGEGAELHGESLVPLLENYRRWFFRSRAFLLFSHLIRSLHPPPPPPQSYQQNQGITALQQAVEANGARLMLVEYLRVNDEGRIVSALVGLQPRFRAPVVRTYDAFRLVNRPVRELILDQVHPSALGHELIGRCIADEMIRLGWITSSEK
jgi:lysophospholipase L1-like esterase